MQKTPRGIRTPLVVAPSEPAAKGPPLGVLVRLGAGLVFIIAAVGAFVREESRAQGTLFVEAEVVADRGGGGAYRAYDVKVPKGDGDMLFGVKVFALFGGSWQVGEKMPLRYKPEAPEQAFVDTFRTRHTLSIMLALVGAGAFAFAGVRGLMKRDG